MPAGLAPWMAIASYGAWHPGVPQGKVFVYATRGGTHARHAQRRKFLVPASEVAGLAPPFLVNLATAEEVP